MPIRLTDAQSNVPHNVRYAYTGRGGAGNYHQLPAPPTAAPTASASASGAANTTTAANHASSSSTNPALPSQRHHQRRPSMSTTGVPVTTTAAAAASSHSTSNARYTTGRGGAGNIHTASERPMFFFDEELERMYARDEHAAPVFHIGRGGAGNTIAGPPTSSVDYSHSAYGPHRASGDNYSSRRSSNGSADTESRGRLSGDEVWRRLSQTLSRH